MILANLCFELNSFPATRVLRDAIKAFVAGVCFRFYRQRKDMLLEQLLSTGRGHAQASMTATLVLRVHPRGHVKLPIRRTWRHLPRSAGVLPGQRPLPTRRG